MKASKKSLANNFFMKLKLLLSKAAKFFVNENIFKNIAKKIEGIVKSLSRRQKRSLLLLGDVILFILSIYSALWFRFEFWDLNLTIWRYVELIPLAILIKSIVFQKIGIYRSVLRYGGSAFIRLAFKAVLLSSGLLAVMAYFIEPLQAPRSVIVNDAFLTFFLVVNFRLLIRWVIYRLNYITDDRCSDEKVVIYGAGYAGAQLAQALARNPAYRIIAFVDDNPSLQNHFVEGIPVFSTTDLSQIFATKGFETILLAMPSINGQRKQEILKSLQSFQVTVKTVPSISEILSGNISISKLRNIDIVDLLGREQVAPNKDLLQLDITGKSVLVTGAGGSIGSELCRQIVKQKPKCLVLYEINEFALYSIDIELAEAYPDINRIACLGSINDEDFFKKALNEYQVNTVYHAAAYKHVPLVEANPDRGILNNSLGTLTAARCAIECGVNKFVLISTDKAVRPTNVMGATKRVAELILQALADRKNISTCFTMVRFGNVLGSSGSVVPRFRQQIAQGEPITVTHLNITRYFMSIPEAASLVVQAGAMSKGGEVFLLDMGEPVRIYDLAVQMIRLSGLEPGKDIEIKITGLRPGEKIYEELLIDTANAKPTQHPKIFCAHEAKIPWEVLQPRLESLFFYAQRNNHQNSRLELQKIVPEYKPFWHSDQKMEEASLRHG